MAFCKIHDAELLLYATVLTSFLQRVGGVVDARDSRSKARMSPATSQARFISHAQAFNRCTYCKIAKKQDRKSAVGKT